MINNTEVILAQSTLGMEDILTKLLENVIEKEKNEELNIDSAEKLIGKTIKKVTTVILSMIGNLLNNIVERDNCQCKHCNKSLSINKKSVNRSIMSIYGAIQVKRDTLFCRLCHEGRGVNDDFLGIKNHFTKGITELAAYMGQLLASFDEGEKTVEKFLGFLDVKISATTIREISEVIGKKVFDESIEVATKIFDSPQKYIEAIPENEKKGNLYILMDGSHVNTIEKNDTGTTWREMKLGEVFSDRDIIHTKSDGTIITKKEYVTYFGGVGEFKKVVLSAAVNADYGNHKETLVLGDGACWIWNMANELFPDSKQLLDFYHLSENINDYAKVVFPGDEVNRKRWVDEILLLFRTGKEDEAIGTVKSCNISKDKVPSGTVNLPDYLEKNRERLNYKDFIDNGYYIGSGPIESGNKTVIQQRMKQAGMRWSIEGGQYIAALRAKYKSDLWKHVIDTIESA